MKLTKQTRRVEVKDPVITPKQKIDNGLCFQGVEDPSPGLHVNHDTQFWPVLGISSLAGFSFIPGRLLRAIMCDSFIINCGRLRLTIETECTLVSISLSMTCIASNF